MRASQRILAAAIAFAGLCGMAGCGPDGPKTYTVRGRVEVAGGEAKHLAGANVEAALDSDPTQRASGVIEPDGTFALETLHEGKILKGAQAGSYKARIVLSDDGDRESKRQQRTAVHPKFFKFETSGLTFQVPTNGEVVLQVSPR
ncbi:MAG TPA: hypothetical protein VKD90_28030 [Gemmataceae bacterium]|nr:hypothetical protein [Gemmataceae bacterium]